MKSLFLFVRLDSTDTNGEDSTSSSSEEEKEADGGGTAQVNGHSPCENEAPASLTVQVNGTTRPQLDEVEEEEEEGNSLPTIFFTHTVEPKKVRSLYKSYKSFFFLKKTTSLFQP